MRPWTLFQRSKTPFQGSPLNVTNVCLFYIFRRTGISKVQNFLEVDRYFEVQNFLETDWYFEGPELFRGRPVF
ncbi:hypothetical protein RCL_jg19384.t1 [Rhizophagus clarus]|uniref:Uncharacterized protein n=1 Tax=Rhizophagus clarus TaxID=94130 RepID=A0A8H3QZR9_9GLOM|nr:hypothetical protein RCL_jg19384.t1 [Rhizophagus clarus]